MEVQVSPSMNEAHSTSGLQEEVRMSPAMETMIFSCVQEGRVKGSGCSHAQSAIGIVLLVICILLFFISHYHTVCLSQN